MRFLEIIFSAIIAYIVPAFLDSLRDSSKEFSWSRWSFAHAIGGGLGGVISAAMGLVLQGVGNWAMFGASVGIMQWFVLPRYLDIGNFWALASMIGWTIFAGFQAIKFPPGNWGWFFTGLVVGILQWFCLKGKAKRAIWWIPANGIAWLVAGFIGFHTGFAIIGVVTEATKNPFIGGAIGWVIGWTIIGLIGGLILGLPITQMSQISNTNS